MATLTFPTLGALIGSVRNLLGQPNAINSAWTDLELKSYINEAIRMYFSEVVKNHEGYFTVTTDPASGGTGNLTYTANQDYVPLPSDCFEVRAVYMQYNQTWQILQYYNNITDNISINVGAGGSNTYTPCYSFRGNNLVLNPVPSFTGLNAIKLDYVQLPDQMINGGDALTNQVSPVFKQLLEMYAVYKAKLKQSMVSGTDLTSLPKANLEEIYASFKNTINKRSAYPEYVVPFNPEGF